MTSFIFAHLPKEADLISKVRKFACARIYDIVYRKKL